MGWVNRLVWRVTDVIHAGQAGWRSGTAAAEGKWIGEQRDKAVQGDIEAQFNLALIYGNGKLVPRDLETAATWFRLAAEQGHVRSQFALGTMYEEGEGIPQDYAKAERWLRLAAEQGFAEAQFALGNMYADARGVPRNYGEAAIWLRKAAEQGIDDAALKLSGMYATAHLQCSSVDAEFAAVAKGMCDALAAKMTPEQIAVAKRLADEIRRK